MIIEPVVVGGVAVIAASAVVVLARKLARDAQAAAYRSRMLIGYGVASDAVVANARTARQVLRSRGGHAVDDLP